MTEYKKEIEEINKRIESLIKSGRKFILKSFKKMKWTKEQKLNFLYHILETCPTERKLKFWFGTEWHINMINDLIHEVNQK